MRSVKRKTEFHPPMKASKVAKKSNDEPLMKAFKVSKAKQENTKLMISQLDILVKERDTLKELSKQKDERIVELEKILHIFRAKGNSSKSIG